MGTPWRESAMTEGRVRFSSATRYAPDTSFESHGRSVSTLGMLRSDSSISIGWWVGPSSPRPIESCVIT